MKALNTILAHGTNLIEKLLARPYTKTRQLFLLPILVILTFTTQLWGQGHCDTQFPEPDTTGGPSALACSLKSSGAPILGNPLLCDEPNNDFFLVRTYVHIVRKSNGTSGQSLSAINESLNIMVEKFAKFNIAFSFVGMDTINSDDYYHYSGDPLARDSTELNHPNEDFLALTSENFHTDAIDIYFLPQGIYGNAEALVFDTGPSTACVVGGGAGVTNSILLAHEIGHVFGLLHTFTDKYDNPGGPCKGDDPSPCCGDFVFDTPYEHPSFPVFCVDVDCSISSSCSDTLFNIVMPMIANIMSYSPRHCRDSFTLGQSYRMKRFLSTCQTLQLIVTDTLKVSGVHITFNQPYTVGCLPQIIIGNGGRLTVPIEISMQEDKKIEVKPGGRLIVNGGHIKGCGGSHWQGIEAMGKPTLPQIPFSNQGLVLLNPNSTIDRARVPFNAHDGGIVRADGVLFRNCGEGIFADYPLPSFSQIKNSTFTRNGFYGLPLYLNQIYMQNMTNVNIVGSHFTTINPSGTDFNGNAIMGGDAKFSVTGTTVTGYYRGVAGAAWGTNPAAVFTVKGCTFTDNLVGVSSWGLDNVTVRDNIFKGIGTHPGANVKRGLDLWNCTGFTVRDNQFIGSGGHKKGQSSVGVVAMNTGGEGNLIQANTFEGLNVANQAEYVNRDFLNPKLGLQYWCNDNKEGNNHDFYIWDDGIAGEQGESGNATKNTFSHPNTTSPNTTYEDFNNQSNNPLNYHHLNLPIETPQLNYYIGLSLEIETETSTCNEIIDDTKLTNEEEQLLVEGFNNVKDNYHNQIHTYGSLPPDSEDAITLLKSMAANKSTMHRIANKIISSEFTDTTGLNLPKIRTWLANKESREADYSIVETYLSEADTLAARQVRDSIPIKHILSPAQLVEHNYYCQWTELKIGLLSNSKDLLSLDSVGVAQVQALAESSNEITGSQTRGFLNTVHGFNYQLYPKIPGENNGQGLMAPPAQGRPSAAQPSTLQTLSVQPNPAKDHVNLVYAFPEGVSYGVLHISDINGRQAEHIELFDQSGSFQISTEHLLSGIYYCTLRYAGGNTSPIKLVIIK